MYNPRFPEVIHNTHQELKDMLILSLYLLKRNIQITLQNIELNTDQ